MSILTSGLTTALLSAQSSAKLASQPMNMVSRELKKLNPDLQIIKRAGSYGGDLMQKADKSLEQAQEEFRKAQEIASEEKKIEEKLKLEEQLTENDTKETIDIDASPNPNFDTVEINTDILPISPNTQSTNVDITKTYTPSGLAAANLSGEVAITGNSPSNPLIDVKA